MKQYFKLSVLSNKGSFSDELTKTELITKTTLMRNNLLSAKDVEKIHNWCETAKAEDTLYVNNTVVKCIGFKD